MKRASLPLLRRRKFITLLGGAAAWPLAARSQQASTPVIGVLGSTSSFGDLQAFRRGLSETGYVEGRNVAIEYRWADDQNDRLPALAADLVRRQVAVIATAGGSVTALAAKQATSTIPIVFEIGTDPVAAGLVASLNRPGGNLTGVTNLSTELAPKQLELLHELIPTATIIAELINPTNLTNADALSRGLQAAAGVLGLRLHVLHAITERDFDTAFVTLVQLHARALVIGGDPFFFSRLEQLAALTLRYALPATYGAREFTVAGGLMSYSSSISDAFYRVGVYTGRIVKGEKPADLPVQQAAKVELALNLKTAKALGITVPLTLRGRADEIIE
jgi:putative ABC transport system substrate-binding protein